MTGKADLPLTCRLTNRSSGRVENKVPRSHIDARAAQINRFGGCSSQHKPAWAWLGLAVIGAQFLLVVPQAYADPQAIVTVSCDREKGELRVDESVEDIDPLPGVIAPGAMTFSPSSLVDVNELDGALAWEDQPVSRECQLGSDVYVAEFRGRKANYNIQGECGGNPETLSLTLQRDGKVLFKDLVLHDGCRAVHEISSIRIIGSKHEVVATIATEFVEELREVHISMDTEITRESIIDAAWPTMAP